MKLTNLFNSDTKETTIAVPKKAGETQSGKNFDKLMSTFEKRQAQEQPIEKPATDNQQKPLSKDEEKNITPELKEKLSTAKPVETKPKQTDTEDDTEINAEAIIAAVAEILQVPPEELLVWLGTLELEPADLTDKKAVVELLKLAFDAPDVPMLLKEPEFPEAYKAINEAIAKLRPETPVAFELPTQAVETVNVPVLPNLQVTTDDNNKTVITEVPETAKAEKTDQLPLKKISHAQNENKAEIKAKTESNSPTPTPRDELVEARQDIMEIPVSHLEKLATRVADTVENVRQINNPVSTSDVMNQIMSRVRTQSGEQFAELRIMLKPENLGEVSLRVLTQNGIVTAQFVAENQRIKEILEANFNLLRETLHGQGVQISDLSVSVKQGNEERMNQFAHARQNSRARMQRITNVQAEAVDETGFGDEVDPSVLLRGNMNLKV